MQIVVASQNAREMRVFPKQRINKLTRNNYQGNTDCLVNLSDTLNKRRMIKYSVNGL